MFACWRNNRQFLKHTWLKSVFVINMKYFNNEKFSNANMQLLFCFWYIFRIKYSHKQNVIKQIQKHFDVIRCNIWMRFNLSCGVLFQNFFSLSPSLVFFTVRKPIKATTSDVKRHEKYDEQNKQHKITLILCLIEFLGSKVLCSLRIQFKWAVHSSPLLNYNENYCCFCQYIFTSFCNSHSWFTYRVSKNLNWTEIDFLFLIFSLTCDSINFIWKIIPMSWQCNYLEYFFQFTCFDNRQKKNVPKSSKLMMFERKKKNILYIVKFPNLVMAIGVESFVCRRVRTQYFYANLIFRRFL